MVIYQKNKEKAMNKKELLESLNKNKRYHEFQTIKVKDLVEGKRVYNLSPPDPKECEFGKWLINPDNNLKILLGSIFYNNLTTYHINWHKEYEIICNFFFTDGDIKDEPKKLSDEDLQKCKSHYEQITVIEKEITKMIKSCERRINALSEDKF